MLSVKVKAYDTCATQRDIFKDNTVVSNITCCLLQTYSFAGQLKGYRCISSRQIVIIHPSIANEKRVNRITRHKMITICLILNMNTIIRPRQTQRFVPRLKMEIALPVLLKKGGLKQTARFKIVSH